MPPGDGPTAAIRVGPWSSCSQGCSFGKGAGGSWLKNSGLHLEKGNYNNENVYRDGERGVRDKKGWKDLVLKVNSSYQPLRVSAQNQVTEVHCPGPFFLQQDGSLCWRMPTTPPEFPICPPCQQGQNHFWSEHVSVSGAIKDCEITVTSPLAQCWWLFNV